MKNIFGFILTASLIFVADSAQAACSLAKSVYRDVDKRGFELSFSDRPAGSVFLATATLTHSKRGKIFEFNVVQSQGYGSTWLINRKDNGKSHLVNFFNADLTQATVFRSETSPTYLFVSDLGAADYYRNELVGSRKIILGDVMWKFYRCR